MGEKFTLIIFLIYTNVYCQYSHENIWITGVNALVKNRILDFNNGIAPVTVDSASVGTPFIVTNTSISDTLGNLLFYSNGINVYDRNFNIMPNGNYLSPCPWSQSLINNGLDIGQAALIIPKPNDINKYYIFHLSIDLYNNPNPIKKPGTLFFSKVDMLLNGGLGALSFKNDTLFRDTLIADGITAVKHANGRDWWMVSHEFNSNRYYKWLITPDSIIGPSSQFIGSVINSPDNGQLCFSPDGSKFCIISNPYSKKIDIYDFDRCTGMFSSFTPISFTDSSAFAVGCSFSSNSRYLYVCSNYLIYQFDTQNPNIASSKTVIGVHDNVPSIGGSPDLFYIMQLAPDNKIYINSNQSSFNLHVIENPDLGGISSNFVIRGLPVYNYVWAALPTYPNYELGALIGSTCDTLLTISENESEEQQVTIFPNPFSNIIKLNHLPDKGKLTIENLLGEIVFSETLTSKMQEEINLHFLSSGMYFLNIENNGNSYTKKIIKQ